MHYFRDMYRTIDKNDSAEFKEFFDELYGIPVSAMKLHKRYDLVQDMPRRSIRGLQNRIDALATGTYKDPDCNRYAKRLRRGGRVAAGLPRTRGRPVPQQHKRAGVARIRHNAEDLPR